MYLHPFQQNYKVWLNAEIDLCRTIERDIETEKATYNDILVIAELYLELMKSRDNIKELLKLIND